MKTMTAPRNPWPIAIVAFFVVFATFIATFIVWALGHKQDLVTENYYENEIRYQEQLDRLNRTQAFAPQTAVKFDGERNCIVVTLPASQAATATGRIHLYRPSNEKLDREVPLAINAGGEQTLDASALAAGLWKVRIEWRVDGQEYFFDQAVILTGTPVPPPSAAVEKSSSSSVSSSSSILKRLSRTRTRTRRRTSAGTDAPNRRPALR